MKPLITSLVALLVFASILMAQDPKTRAQRAAPIVNGAVPIKAVATPKEQMATPIAEDARPIKAVPTPKDWHKTMALAGKGRGAPRAPTEVWGVGVDDSVWRWNGNSWAQPNPVARLGQLDVSSLGGVWGIGSNGRVFRTFDGASWSEPNPAAKLYQVTGNLYYAAWGIGWAGRVFASVDGGLLWFEPNVQAAAKQVSAGNWDKG